MVWGEQPLTASGHMLCSLDVIAEPFQAGLDDTPRSPFVMALKVPNILKDHIRGLVHPQYLQNLMEECPRSLVLQSGLSA